MATYIKDLFDLPDVVRGGDFGGRDVRGKIVFADSFWDADGRAREQGAAAASAFGAGFGGAVWAMVARNGAEDFTERWKAGFAAAHPARAARARFLLTMPGAPAGSGIARG